MFINTGRSKQETAGGFTLLELVFVSVAIVVLVALAAPAIVRSRESARSSACMSNQLQISQAILAYESHFHELPIGAVKTDKPGTQGFGVIPAILPLLSENALVDQIDWNESHILLGNSKLLAMDGPNVIRCPADNISIAEKRSINYVVNAGSDAVMSNPEQGDIKFLGAFDFGTAVSLDDFSDGVANTALMAERLVGNRPSKQNEVYARAESGKGPRDLADITGVEVARGKPDEFVAACAKIEPDHRGWIVDFGRNWTIEAHYVHILKPNASVPDCGYQSTYPLAGAISARSYHPGHVVVGFADGHLDKVSNEIDMAIWRAMGTRSGNE